MKKILGVFLLSTILSMPVFAGLPDAVQAFEKADYEAAYPEMIALANEGNPVAAYYLGRMYDEGLGVKADTTTALRYFEQADKGYNSDASVQLGLKILKGEGVTQNTDLGIQYLKKAAYAGNENALYELGRLYENGEGVEKNYTYSFGFFYMSALKGKREAQVETARHYLSGRGIPQDFGAAVKWYVRAANQGYIPAQQEWAELRMTNPRLHNPIDAFSWYSILAAYNSDEIGRAAAAKRDAIGAGFNPALMEVQQKRIANWRPVPAEQSVPPQERMTAVLPVIPGFNDEETTKNRLTSGAALQTDGTLYGITGRMIEDAAETGNRSVLEKAVNMAADRGQVKAYGYYGDLLRSRFQDDATAVLWYRKGAELGEFYAQYQLGKSYCEGRGINPADIAVCYSWMLGSAKSADKNLALTVQDAIRAIEGEATTEELAKGKELLVERQKNQEEAAAAAAQKSKKTPGLFNLF